MRAFILGLCLHVEAKPVMRARDSAPLCVFGTYLVYNFKIVQSASHTCVYNSLSGYCLIYTLTALIRLPFPLNKFFPCSQQCGR